MKRTKEAILLHFLSTIGNISAKKHTLRDLRLEVERVLRKLYPYARIYIAIGQISPAHGKAGSFENGFGAFVAQKGKTVIVTKGLDDFCKRHGIAPARHPVRSAVGVPLLYSNELCGVIVMLNTGKGDAFTLADASLVTLLSGQLASEIVHERLHKERKQLLEANRHLSLTDKLTNMPNRRFFDMILDIEFRKAKGYTRQLSLAMISPDQRHTATTRQSRQESNALFVHVARTLKRNIRDTDFIARYGRDEFIVLLPEAMNESAVNAAERVRKAVEQTPLILQGSAKKKTTISVGIVTYPSSAENLDVLLEQANNALNRAKQLGRNQVVSL